MVWLSATLVVLVCAAAWIGGLRLNAISPSNFSVSFAQGHNNSLLDAIKIGTNISTDNSQGKVYFAGNTYWLTARDDDKVTLYAANNYADKQFAADGSNDYATSDIRNYLVNTQGNSFFEDFMKDTRMVDWNIVKATHITSDVGSASALDDKFYLPKGTYAMTEIYAPDSEAIRTRYWKNNAWLRTTRNVINKKYANWTRGSTDTVTSDNTTDSKGVLPACALEPSSIIFASSKLNGSEVLNYSAGTSYNTYKKGNVILTLNDSTGSSVKSSGSARNLKITNGALTFGLTDLPVAGEKLAVVLSDGTHTQMVIGDDIVQNNAETLNYTISANKIPDFSTDSSVNAVVLAYTENTSPISSLTGTISDYKIRYAKPLGGQTIEPSTQYSVIYNGNGNTSPDTTIPGVDTFNEGGSVVIKDGVGLSQNYKTFNGWNTNPYGTGTHYDAGATYSENAHLILYAEWLDSRTVTNIVISNSSALADTSYIVGETFDPSGLAIDLADKDGNTISTIPYNEITASDFSFEPGLTTGLTISDKSIKINYGGFSTYAFIMVSENTQEENYTIQTRIINQPVDHNNKDSETFPQRYKILTPNNLSDQYIVFYLMGNEQTLADSIIQTAYTCYGSRNDVVYVIGEHRGYGTSITEGDQSLPSYINDVDQALEDYHEIQNALKPEFQGKKWAVGGYSYGGGLSIAYADKYSNDVSLVHSSSGVVDWKFMVPEYDKKARENLGEGMYGRLCNHIDNLSPATPFNDNWYNRELIYALVTAMAQKAEFQSLNGIFNALTYLPTRSFVKAVKLVDKLFGANGMVQYATSNSATSLTHEQAATGAYSWRVWRWQQFFQTGTLWAPYDSSKSIYTRSSADWIAEGKQLFGSDVITCRPEDFPKWNVRSFITSLKTKNLPLVFVRGDKDPWSDLGLAKSEQNLTTRMFIMEEGYHCPDRVETDGIPVMNSIVEIMGY